MKFVSIQRGVGIFSDRHTREMHMSLLAMCKYESMKLANMCKKSCYSLCVWTSAITPRSLSRQFVSQQLLARTENTLTLLSWDAEALITPAVTTATTQKELFMVPASGCIFFPNLVPEQTADGWTLSNLSNLLVVQRQWSWGKWTEDILSLQWRKLDFRSERLILREVPIYWKKV